ncbi:MAG: archease [Chloroflexi bacterium]|nr:MAG: archease [Chloroflexota bacterium]
MIYTVEVKRAFEIIDHVADVGIVAYGKDAKELFSNAALALFSLITEPESIEEKLQLDLEVSSEDMDSLLVEWLNELIYLFDVERILFSRFDIRSLTRNELDATCYGEGIDSMKHKIKLGVKAATYHMLKLEQNGDGYKAQIILDI